MSTKHKAQIRYSLSFKQEIVRLYEKEGITINELMKRYGISGGETISKWIRKFGSPDQLRIIRVETPKDKSLLNELKKQNQELKNALSHQTVKNIVYESLLESIAQEQGITVEQLKKNIAKK
jgi:transposase-like protein